MTPSTSLRTSRSIAFARRNPAAIALLVLFVSAATLVAVFHFAQRATADHAGSWHVIERVSVSSFEDQGNNHSETPSVSADGRYVAFASTAANLVLGDTNGARDIFVHDRDNGITERVSVESNGNQATGGHILSEQSREPVISADGRYVAFTSSATNLVPGDSNVNEDVFVHDRNTDTTERVSVDSNGNQGNFGSHHGLAISADGRYVAFRSDANNLVLGDTNSQYDIFVHDRDTDTTERVSIDSFGNQGNGNNLSPRISADGRYVAFASLANNLVPNDTNNRWDVFVRDRDTDATERVSVDGSGSQVNGDSVDAAISADGRYVVFRSYATNLVLGDTNNIYDLFVRDRDANTIGRISVDSNGNQVNGGSEQPAISADGRYVAFTSFATNLVPNDTNNRWDVFVRDRDTDATERVSISSSGNQGNDHSEHTSISADGRYVAFFTAAGNLVPGDTNNRGDIFVAAQGPKAVNLAQYRSDTTTPIDESGTTDESVVVLKANVSSPESDQVKLQVEVRETNVGLTGVYDEMDGAFIESGPVTSGTTATTARFGLINGDYHWQARAVDDLGNESPWEEFGTGDPDFTVRLPINVAVILARTQGSTFSRPATDFIDPNSTNDIDSQLRNYFCENSFGDYVDDECVGGLIDVRLELAAAGQVLELPRDLAYYGVDNPSGRRKFTVNEGVGDGNGKEISLATAKDQTIELLWDAINRANDLDPSLDFNEFDSVLVVHEGRAQQPFPGGNTDTSKPLTFAWPVAYSPTNSPSEVAQNWISLAEDWDVAAWAHEFGHVLGELVTDKYLCDLVPSREVLGCGQVGVWDLMGADGAHIPSRLSSYSKLDLGWLTKHVVFPGSFAVTGLAEMQQNEGVRVISIDDDHYYLVEARSTDGTWDSELPHDQAIVVYHVAERVLDDVIYPDQTIAPVQRDFIQVVDEITSGLNPYRDPINNVLIDLQSFNGGPPFSANLEYSINLGLANELIANIQPNNELIEDLPPEALGLELPVSASFAQGDIPIVGKPYTQKEKRVIVLKEIFGLQENIGWLFYLGLAMLLGGIVGVIRLSRRRTGVLAGWPIVTALIVFGLIAMALVALVFADRVENSPHSAPANNQEMSGGQTNAESLLGIPNVDQGGSILDIDLHAYDDQGNHVGMNYETGEYEINIPDARTSGERVYAEEWISVPEGTEVRYEVSRHDIEQFFAENPDIAASLESLEETYTFGAVTYDASSTRYEATPVENITINPGETRIHEIGGTTEEPTVDEGVVMTELIPTDDTYLKKGNANQNFGGEEILNVRGDGKRRTLIQFDQEAIEEMVGEGELISASLEFAIVDGSTSNWTTEGRLVGAYRLTHAWEEMGATWNCGNDTDTSNGSPNCSGETWEMEENSDPSWLEPATDDVLITNGLSGAISWDIAQDVEAFLNGTNNYGWILRKAVDTQSGDVEFHSRETALVPKLILTIAR